MLGSRDSARYGAIISHSLELALQSLQCFSSFRLSCTCNRHTFSSVQYTYIYMRKVCGSRSYDWFILWSRFSLRFAVLHFLSSFSPPPWPRFTLAFLCLEAPEKCKDDPPDATLARLVLSRCDNPSPSFLSRDPHTLVQLTSFLALNKFQPFHVSISSNTLMLLVSFIVSLGFL